jgi:hypothetical protein
MGKKLARVRLVISASLSKVQFWPRPFKKERKSHFRWMQIRRIELKTADGLSPLPMSSAWVRDGLFLVRGRHSSGLEFLFLNIKLYEVKSCEDLSPTKNILAILWNLWLIVK